MKKCTIEKTREPMPTWETLEAYIRHQIQAILPRVLEEAVEAVLGRLPYERRTGGTPRWYRNGHGRPRKVAFLSGTVVVRRPRVRGLDERFESRVPPLFRQRTSELGQELLALYFHGLAQDDFALALRGLLGDGAPLSAASIDRIDANLTLAAFEHALDERRPRAGYIHHSDRGVQYAERDYVGRLDGHGFGTSMSRTGNPYDNARAESFFKTLKVEEVDVREYVSIADVRRRIGRFFEEVYNRERLHSELRYTSPEELKCLFIQMRQAELSPSSCPA